MLCIINYFLVIIQAIFPTRHYFYLHFAVILTHFIIVIAIVVDTIIFTIAFVDTLIFSHVD